MSIRMQLCQAVLAILFAATVVSCAPVTVAKLEKSGQRPLSDDEIHTLLVGKTVYSEQPDPIRAEKNLSRIYYDASGVRYVSVNRKAPAEVRYSIRESELCYESNAEGKTFCGKIFKEESKYLYCDAHYRGRCLVTMTQIVDGDVEHLKQ